MTMTMSSCDRHIFFSSVLLILLFVPERSCHPASSVQPCVGNATAACIDHKVSNVLDKISQIQEIKINRWLSVIPCQNCIENTERSLNLKINRKNDELNAWDLIGKAVDTFIETRTLRVKLPVWIQPKVGALDLQFGQALQEGRRRKKGSTTGLLLMSMMGKMALLAMMLIKFKAMKALMIAGIALVMSKLQLFKMMAPMKTGRAGGNSSPHVIVLKTVATPNGAVHSTGNHVETVQMVHEPHLATAGTWNSAGDNWVTSNGLNGAAHQTSGWNSPASTLLGSNSVATSWGRSAYKDEQLKLQNLTLTHR